MPTKDKAASDGFRRGFLLSTPQKKTKKKKHRTPALEMRETTRSETNTELSTGSSDNHDKKTVQLLPSKPSARPVTGTSSALLDLEDSSPTATTSTSPKHTKSVLHIFDDGNAKKEKQNAKSNHPVSGLLDIRENSNFLDVDSQNCLHGSVMGASEGGGLVEISSTTIRRKKGSLISDVFPKDTKQISPVHVAPRGIADRSEDDATQVSNCFRSLDSNYKDNNRNSGQVASESARDVSRIVPPVENSVATNNTESQELSQRTTNFLQCQQALDRTLWKLRRKRRRKGPAHRKNDNSGEEWRGICEEFCMSQFPFCGSDDQSQSQSQQDNGTVDYITNHSEELQLLSWVWDSLLMACPKKSSQCLAEMRLGSVLLESTCTATGWKAFSNILRPGDVNDKRHRVCALGAITVLDFWCIFQQKQRQQNDTGENTISIDPTWMLDFVENTLPLLGQQLAGQSTRTILGQRCMAQIYSIVDTIVQYYFGLMNNSPEDAASLRQALWNVSEDALEKAWDTQVLWNAQIGGGEVDHYQISSVRKTCTIALVHSWKDIFRKLSSRDDTARASQQWCRLLRGMEMNEKGTWIGSLKQTMLRTDDLFNEDDALACLTRSLKHGEQFYASKHTNTDDSNAQVLLVHGVVGWLVQNKNNQSTRHQEFFEMSSSLVLYSMSDSVAVLVVLIL